jgi:glutamate N-acetyltransferase/amino-acid N-acetyltransferase
VSVTYPRGFRASGVAAGLKESGRPDLGLLVAADVAAAAGAFTTNAFPAASVSVTKSHLSDGLARAVVVNSGQANAGTGDAGFADASSMARSVGEALGCEPEAVLVCSTGVIGPRIDVKRVSSILPSAVEGLSEHGGRAFAEAILTTDLRPKMATADPGTFRVGGCVKGAGMIAPRLAPYGLGTLLAFITTDAAASPEALRRIVTERVAPVWNGLTVDGCQSTNDTVLVLASGAAGGLFDEADLADAVEGVSRDLVRQLAMDAEGATKTIVVQVDGAPDVETARDVGLAVAGSDLVKAAVFGGDPNPGRILQAAGDGGVACDPMRFRASLGGVLVIEAGVVLDARDAKRALEGPEVLVAIDLGSGAASATVFGCDLSYDYIRINAEYQT